MTVSCSAAMAAVQIKETISKSLEAQRSHLPTGHCVFVFACARRGPGLLLQYHAPLADELLCSSLAPLSPDETLHNMSQCGRKWQRCLSPLDQSVIRHITQTVSSSVSSEVRHAGKEREAVTSVACCAHESVVTDGG